MAEVAVESSTPVVATEAKVKREMSAAKKEAFTKAQGALLASRTQKTYEPYLQANGEEAFRKRYPKETARRVREGIWSQ